MIPISRRSFAVGLVALAAAPAYSALSATTLIRGARRAVTMDPAQGEIADADILVRDGAIVAIGINLTMPGATIVDARGCIAMPGLVDTHWHMWNTALRGLSRSAKGGFGPTMAAVSPLVTPRDSAIGVRLACAEAIHAGITTVHNWAHNVRSPAHAEAEWSAMVDTGIRGRFSYGYPQDARPDRNMDLAHLATMARRPRQGTLSLGVCARGPDRSSDAVWHAEWDAVRRLGLPISTHMASDAAAAEKRGIARLAARNGLGPDVQLVHLTKASSADLATVARGGSPVSISPWTELEVGYGLPPIVALAHAGVTMGLSVDNMVLAGNADLFSVMKLTSDLAAGMTTRQGAIADETVLRWATADGARSLGMTTGVLAPGRPADIILVRADAVNTAPVADAAAMLTHAATPANVEFVMIDGVVHKAGGRLTRVDLPALLTEAQRTFARLSDAVLS